MTVESKTQEYTSKFQVPVIDFYPFLHGSHDDKLKVGKEMVTAMREVGFMYVMNHGITQEDQVEIFLWSERFFKLSLQQKSKCPHPAKGEHHRGWSSVGKEKAVQLFDKVNLEKLKKVPDVKESFDLGNENNKKYYNIWPDEEDIPDQLLLE
ncbi:unnamed protein product [Ambrosiozyma monospora]|uniref:Unnamed protein product n=1 Tax=Ambrosiozyma monospora TaxID=43982 RepID=A0ACB5U6A8_AMBMO|nr:unnamed protein product [Ambrosiozyma monospora]